MSFKPKELNPEYEGKKCGAKLAKSVCKLLNEPRFKVGDTVYFYGLNGIEKGMVVWAYRGECFVQNLTFVGARKQAELYATEEEARNAK